MSSHREKSDFFLKGLFAGTGSVHSVLCVDINSHIQDQSPGSLLHNSNTYCLFSPNMRREKLTSMKTGYANKSGFNVSAVRVGAESESKDVQTVRTHSCTGIIFITSSSCGCKEEYMN